MKNAKQINRRTEGAYNLLRSDLRFLPRGSFKTMKVGIILILVHPIFLFIFFRRGLDREYDINIDKIVHIFLFFFLTVTEHNTTVAFKIIN